MWRDLAPAIFIIGVLVGLAISDYMIDADPEFDPITDRGVLNEREE